MSEMAALDSALIDRIEKLAQYVAQANGAMENTVRDRQRTNPLFGKDGTINSNIIFGVSTS